MVLENENLCPISYAARLKDHFKYVRPVPTHLNYRLSQTRKDLSTCPFVFVRVVSVRKLLQPLYDCPFKVLERKPKYYVIDHNGNKDSVSVGRLKPAYIDPTDSPSLANPNCSPTQHPSKASGSTPLNKPDQQPMLSISLHKQTRSGRTIRLPLHRSISLNTTSNRASKTTP